MFHPLFFFEFMLFTESEIIVPVTESGGTCLGGPRVCVGLELVHR